MDDVVLHVEGVVAGYVPDLPILKGVDLKVRPCESGAYR